GPGVAGRLCPQPRGADGTGRGSPGAPARRLCHGQRLCAALAGAARLAARRARTNPAMSAPAYEVVAAAFAAEGTELHFTLMGNANMYWADALARLHGVRTIHARHEHCAVGMASGYARATGRVGVASVTDGPGFTQIATELTVAARSRLPLV